MMSSTALKFDDFTFIKDGSHRFKSSLAIHEFKPRFLLFFNMLRQVR
jgi:hypothetical protein